MDNFRVKRPHLGDKMYSVGQLRKADKNDVAHLVANGVLEPVGPKNKPAEKKAAAPKNKRAPAPSNKGGQPAQATVKKADQGA